MVGHRARREDEHICNLLIGMTASNKLGDLRLTARQNAIALRAVRQMLGCDRRWTVSATNWRGPLAACGNGVVVQRNGLSKPSYLLSELLLHLGVPLRTPVCDRLRDRRLDHWGLWIEGYRGVHMLTESKDV